MEKYFTDDCMFADEKGRFFDKPKFFRKAVEGRILFRYDAAGKVNALIDRRNNEDVVWRKATK